MGLMEEASRAGTKRARAAAAVKMSVTVENPGGSLNSRTLAHGNLFLASYFFLKEFGHKLQRLLGLRELEVVPEGVGESFKDD
jgi:hypothetical protein